MKKIYIIIGVLTVLLAGGGVYLQYFSDGDSSLTTESGKQEAGDLTLEPLGPAPEFAGISNWLNSEALTMEQLRGKVVLIDFWTYSCINCIRTLPYITEWQRKYSEKGLVIVGVHTPEFEFEKDAGNVQTALKRHGIEYPVAQDNNYRTWRAWSNRYWPAKYLVDQNGQVVYYHFGEGDYDVTEEAIQKLLDLENVGFSQVESERPGDVKTPEIYFGTLRNQNFAAGLPSDGVAEYTLPKNLSDNTFALEGQWEFTPEYSSLVSGQGKIRLNYHAEKVFMVAESSFNTPVRIRTYVDGKLYGEVTITDSDLYRLVEEEQSGDHVLEIEILDTGLKAYTFTFG